MRFDKLDRVICVSFWPTAVVEGRTKPDSGPPMSVGRVTLDLVLCVEAVVLLGVDEDITLEDCVGVAALPGIGIREEKPLIGIRDVVLSWG